MKTFWMKLWTDGNNKPGQKTGLFYKAMVKPGRRTGLFLKDRRPDRSLVGVFFNKPDIEVSRGLGDAVDASGLAVLPEGKAVR